MRHLEDNEQITLFKWAALQSGKYPVLELMYHIPNGGKRNKAEAARFKCMGVKAGVPDIHLPVSDGIHHSLYIELKAKNGTVSAAQRKYITALQGQGHRVEVCYGWENAALVLLDYLEHYHDEVREYAEQIL